MINLWNNWWNSFRLSAGRVRLALLRHINCLPQSLVNSSPQHLKEILLVSSICLTFTAKYHGMSVNIIVHDLNVSVDSFQKVRQCCRPMKRRTMKPKYDEICKLCNVVCTMQIRNIYTTANSLKGPNTTYHTSFSFFNQDNSEHITVDTQLPKNTFETSMLSRIYTPAFALFVDSWVRAIRLVELIQDQHSRGALAIVSSYFGSALRRWLSCIPGGHDEQKHGITMNPSESIASRNCKKGSRTMKLFGPKVPWNNTDSQT